MTARLTAEELDARVERALSARTQGELAALVADLSAATATATKDVLVVKQTGGKWTRAGRWTVPSRIEVRTKLCRVTFDFTDAVITSRTVRVDTEMQHGKLVSRRRTRHRDRRRRAQPRVLQDQAPLGQCRRRPRAPHRARRNAQAREGRRAAAVSLSWSKTRFWHDCIYGTWQMIFVIDQLPMLAEGTCRLTSAGRGAVRRR